MALCSASLFSFGYWDAGVLLEDSLEEFTNKTQKTKQKTKETTRQLGSIAQFVQLPFVQSASSGCRQHSQK